MTPLKKGEKSSSRCTSKY